MTRLLDRRTIFAVAAFIIVEIILTPFAAGWAEQGRLDPLLALPMRLVTLLLPLFILRKSAPRHRALGYLLAIGIMTLVHLALTLSLAIRTGWQQELSLMLASGVWVMIGDQFLHPRLGEGRARWFNAQWVRGGGLLLIALVLGFCASFAVRTIYIPPKTDQKVALVTSLPLIWGQDGTEIETVLSGESAGPDPAYLMLQDRFAVTPIDSISAQSLPKSGPLLLAHPRALMPQELVALDTWVRDGGRVLILADAFLAWEPPYPLGDKRNPPITSLLTPLLDHWGLELILPAAGPDSGGLSVMDEGRPLILAAAGVFANRGGPAAMTGKCSISLGGAKAECTIGKGKAILLSDADMLLHELWLAPTLMTNQATRFSPALWRSDNMGWLSDSLTDLAGRPRADALASPVWIKR